MRQPGVAHAIATYTLPPHAPPEVAEARKAFDSIAAKWATVRGELQDAVENLAAAKQADLDHIVRMAEQGKDAAADPQAKQRKVEATITDLRFRLKGLDVAVDEAGNRLADAIAANRQQWLPRLAKAEADAATRFNQAITAAQAALNDLRPARGAIEWLNAFDPELARTGEQPQFAGGRLRVKSWSPLLKGEFDPTELLDLAAKVTVKESPERAVTVHAPERGTPIIPGKVRSHA